MKREKILKHTGVVCLLAMFCCFLWGSAFPSIKIGYRMFAIASDDTAGQVLFAGIRFALAGVLVIAFGSLLGKKVILPSKELLKYAGKLSVFQTILQYVFFYIGLANTTGVKASIIEGANVFIAIFIASVIFRQEKMTMQKLLGSSVGFAGVVLVNLTGNGLDLNLTLLGEGFILISTVAYAISSVLIKRYSQSQDPVAMSGYQFFIGGCVMILCGLTMGGRVSVTAASSIWILGYLAFISAAAYTVWAILLKYNPVSKVAVFGFMNPVFGVILSALILDENSQSLGWKAIVALALVCAGIFIVYYQKENLEISH